MWKKVINIVFIGTILFSLIGSAILSIAVEDKATSTQENRALTQYEHLTRSNFTDGSWFLNFETYNKDQFVARESFMKIYYGVLDALHVKERNGFVHGVEHYIMPVNAPNISDYAVKNALNYGEAQVEAMSSIQKTADCYGGRVIYLNVPHKTELYTDKYPNGYNNNERIVSLKRKSILEKAKSAGIITVETYDMLNLLKNEYIYYTTDHHWTIKGAYYAYNELLKKINVYEDTDLFYPEWDNLEKHVNTNRMVGSYLKKWGDSGLINEDYMEYAVPYDMPEYKRWDNGVISERLLYSVDRTDYASFMNGDIGNTVLETERNYLPSILYVGFSYTNPLEMMSVYNFATISSIDPRHWEGSICQYVSETKPDYIVIVRDDVYEGNPEFSCIVE